MTTDDKKWRIVIVERLLARNKSEKSNFHQLIQCNNRLFDSNIQLSAENLRLVVENEKARQESGSRGDSSSDNAKIQTLEKKLLAQQEELTGLHKRKGEHSQQMLDLNKKVQELQKVVSDRDSNLAEQKLLNNKLKAEVQMLTTSIQELKKLNTCLRDEHTALQLAFASNEEKLRKAQDDNGVLVEKIGQIQKQMAEKMNDENESFVRKMGERMRRELEDAARDGSRRSNSPVVEDRGSIGKIFMPPMYTDALPNGVQMKFDAHDGEVNAVRWHPIDQIVATGGADRKVKLYDVSKGHCDPKGALVGCNAGVNSVDFDTTGTMIIGTSNDYASRIWTLNDQRLRHTLTGHSGKVMAAKFMGEPSKVVTGSHDRTLKVWDLRNKACIETKFAGSSCNDLVITDGSGSTIISGHFDKKIRFWDTRTDCSANDIVLNGKITSLDLSKDFKYLLCCTRDDTIKLLDLRRNQIITTYSHDNFKVGCDWARVCFSPDGMKLAAGGADGNVYIWNVNGALETMLKDNANGGFFGRTSAITAVSWHPHFPVLASVDREKKCTIWSSTV